MSKRKRICAALLLTILLVTALSVNAEAAILGVYYRPALTFISENAPSDLILRMDLQRGGETVPVFLYREDRLWESRFRLYRQTSSEIRTWYGNRVDFKDAVLVAVTEGREYKIPLTEENLQRLNSNDFFMLDAKAFTINYGLPLWRTVLMFLLRLVITMAVSLIILFFFEYRWKKSWIAAIITNLVVQSGLSIYLANRINFNPKIIIIDFMVLVVVTLLQIPVYWHFLDEDSTQRGVSYGFWANVATGLLNLIFVLQFPL